VLAKRSCGLLLVLVTATVAARAAEKRFFPEARFEKGQLKYIDHLPVLIVAGTPQEMGRQEAALVGDVTKTLAGYPRQLMTLSGGDKHWDKCVAMAETLVSHAIPAHRDELRSFAAKAGVGNDLLDVANTIMDLHRGGFGCSSLMIEPAKSRSGGVLFGRNLDFYSLGILNRYGLVAIYRPGGKHAFASVGFPGLVGCLSGMNDAGLAMAVHEVRLTADGAPLLNSKAMPYTLCFRRILEECTTIQQAERLLRASERSTILSLAICDRTGSGVLEITPKTVVLRRGSDGMCVNTNHFRSDALCVLKICPRYAQLSKAAAMEKLGVSEVFKKLDEVNQDARTVQSMVFEPGPLVLHVAMGSIPATKGPLRTLELKPLFRPAPESQTGPQRERGKPVPALAGASGS
jgi:isopenicillin-N N-acyltransferase like protein